MLAALAISAISVPKAQAFASSTTVSLSGLGVSAFADPQTGNTVDGISSGSTLTVNVAILASSVVPSYQRNITVGFEGDWMSTYQNATNASPGSTLPLSNSQQASVTISVTMPSNGGLTAHSWSVAVWDGPSNSAVSGSCPFGGNGERTPACNLFSYAGAGYHQLAIYTGDQLSAAQASVQAASTISSVSSAIALVTGSLVHTPPPGATAAAGQIAQANTEMSQGSQSWRNGDYGGAKNHYQNALNDANAAAGSLTGQGGGVDEANLVNLVLGGTGIALIGVGALLAGIGAFMHFRRKPKV